MKPVAISSVNKEGGGTLSQRWGWGLVKHQSNDFSWELLLPTEAVAKDKGEKKDHIEEFQHYVVDCGKTGSF